MTKLSVNLNKVALLRNARDINIPSVIEAGRVCIEAGAHGLTVHPRPDERHIRPGDVRDIKSLVTDVARPVEFNIEGYPAPKLLEIVAQAHPDQCTLVPDSPEQSTSDHGWDLQADGEMLRPILANLKSQGIRVSLFMDFDSPDIERAAEIGADRIELYTEPFARSFVEGNGEASAEAFAQGAEQALKAGLGVNAGHDLNLDNLGLFLGTVPNVLEVSIGHALIAEAIHMGLPLTIEKYLEIIDQAQMI